jgi:hypothetical protein
MHSTFKPSPPGQQDIDIVHFPRWLEILLGVIVGGIAVICGAFAAILLVLPFWHREIKFGRLLVLFTVSGILVGVGVFLSWASIKLISGKERKRGYSSPRALRGTAYAFLALAGFILICLSLGDPIVIMPAVIYLGVSLRLLKLASQREKLEQNQSTEPAFASDASRAGH